MLGHKLNDELGETNRKTSFERISQGKLNEIGNFLYENRYFNRSHEC